jgi:hypothetical protein
MPENKVKPYPEFVRKLLGEKSRVLSQAQAFEQMGLAETAKTLWLSAASLEERLAPWTDGLGRDDESAIHRISAGSCYRKGGRPDQAANMFRAALSGTLSSQARADVEKMLAECLEELTGAAMATVGTEEL